jgi:serine/threonine protein kinase
MEVICTRPHCPKPRNQCSDLDDPDKLATIEQKYCTTCGMPLILGGRYLPIRLLGKGGFGAAFLAFDRHRTRNKCVIKQFQPSIKLSPQALETAKNLFIREADALEDLGNAHPQIPDLFAFFPLRVINQLTGIEDQFFYLAQEYIDGQTLEEMLAERKAPFSEAEIQNILEDLLKVLEFVHDNGSIHRDIKPSNIMRGKNGRLYLLDFGAVKQATTSSSDPLEKSTTIYSAGFAPPEQQLGKQVSPATDLYALAVTCITLLTNQDPDNLYDPSEKRWHWQSSAPRVSDRLAVILDRMLQPDPLDRFQSSQEVLTALNASVPVTSSRPSPPSIPSPTTSPLLSPPPGKPIGRSRFTLLEVLAGSAFMGFEGTLLTIALHSVLSASGLVMALMISAGFVFALYQRFLEGKDLPILAMISLGLLLIPPLRGGFGFSDIALLAFGVGIGAIAITAFFRLIYQVVSRFV